MSDDHHGDPNLQHHFEDMDQQFNASKLGMWLFLAQEVLFFAGLFCFYFVFRYNYPELFEFGSQYLDAKWGAINTVVLLISSLTMALAVRCAQTSNKSGLILNLVLTFICAGGFMGIKFVEYKSKLEHGVFLGLFDYYTVDSELAAREGNVAPTSPVERVAHATITPADPNATTIAPPAATPTGITRPPASAGEAHDHSHDGHEAHDHSHSHDDGHGGHALVIHGERPANLHLFFSCYFCLTMLHGIHVLAGMIMLVWLYLGAVKGRYHAGYFTPVDLGGLYWHLVDLVWIFLFPLLYLI
ncbi:MAG: cytochrome c oxidase subunit 3 [Planctomycetota bacterium]